jgi:hypothetical protein
MAAQHDLNVEELLVFSDICNRTFDKQAVWFLNACWNDVKNDAELIYKQVPQMIALETTNGRQGNALDELPAHKFLEMQGESMTVMELRQRLRRIDIDANGRMALLEYLIDKYHSDVRGLMSTDQGKMEVLELVLENVRKEIAAIEQKKHDLQEAATHGHGVHARKASAELFELENADNLPLTKALLTAEAELRKAKRNGSVPAGGIWWIEREIEEMKKYKPKGGVQHIADS